MGEVIKFYCACGQKVGVPAAKIGEVGNCPNCNSPLEVPEDGSIDGGEKVYAAVKLDRADEEQPAQQPDDGSPGTHCRDCGTQLPLLAIRCPSCGTDVIRKPPGTMRATRRRSRETRGKSRKTKMLAFDDIDTQARLPIWFFASFCLDATLFVLAWKIMQMPWYYGLLIGELAGWTVRVLGFKLNL